MRHMLTIAVCLSIFTTAVLAEEKPISFDTNAGKVFVGPKSSLPDDEYTWLVKVDNKIVKEFGREAITPFVFGSPDLYSGAPAVINGTDSASFIVSPAMGGQACAGSEPFIVYLKKGEAAKIIPVKNDCFEISKLKVDGDKFIITMYEHKKDLIYQNGEFINKAPKNEAPKLKKGALSFKVDDEQVLHISGIVTKGNADRPFLKLPEPIKVSVDCKGNKCEKTAAIDELYPATVEFDDRLNAIIGKEVSVTGSFFWPDSWKTPSLSILEIPN